MPAWFFGPGIAGRPVCSLGDTAGEQLDLEPEKETSSPRPKEETMKRETGLTENYREYCDTGAASGQSVCGQSDGECDDECCC